MMYKFKAAQEQKHDPKQRKATKYLFNFSISERMCKNKQIMTHIFVFEF